MFKPFHWNIESILMFYFLVQLLLQHSWMKNAASLVCL